MNSCMSTLTELTDFSKFSQILRSLNCLFSFSYPFLRWHAKQNTFMYLSSLTNSCFFFPFSSPQKESTFSYITTNEGLSMDSIKTALQCQKHIQKTTLTKKFAHYCLTSSVYSELLWLRNGQQEKNRHIQLLYILVAYNHFFSYCYCTNS